MTKRHDRRLWGFFVFSAIGVLLIAGGANLIALNLAQPASMAPASAAKAWMAGETPAPPTIPVSPSPLPSPTEIRPPTPQLSPTSSGSPLPAATATRIIETSTPTAAPAFTQLAPTHDSGYLPVTACPPNPSSSDIQSGNFSFSTIAIPRRYPHWVNYILGLLEAQFDTNTIYHSGLIVYTTLNPELQDEAEKTVKKQVDSLASLDVTNGALVAIRPSTGEILAMVGSADYNNATWGQLNMAILPRQTGTSITPFVYLAAFEKGWTDSTTIDDVPTEFPDGANPPYRPVNYDGRFHGPVLARAALANSYNIPAVKALQFVGIYNEGGLIPLLKRLGITSLNRSDYGLALALGGGEVSVLELTSAYAILADNGSRVVPYAISKITDQNGNVLFQHEPPPSETVVSPQCTSLISSILSDNEARAPSFGAHSVIALPFPAAVKTGFTSDFRDLQTFGYTPDVVVGVWVGNSDYTPMRNTTGVTGAAPIWAEFMKIAINGLCGGTPTPLDYPSGAAK